MPNLIRKTFSVPPLGCNCSILGDEETKQAIVVDPGGDARRILDEVQRLGQVVGLHLRYDERLHPDQPQSPA